MSGPRFIKNNFVPRAGYYPRRVPTMVQAKAGDSLSSYPFSKRHIVQRLLVSDPVLRFRAKLLLRSRPFSSSELMLIIRQHRQMG